MIFFDWLFWVMAVFCGLYLFASLVNIMLFVFGGIGGMFGLISVILGTCFFVLSKAIEKDNY